MVSTVGEMKRTDWRTDKKWSDQYMPSIKAKLGQILIGDAPLEEDQERNTDLIVLRMNAVRIGVRLRRSGYSQNFANEFTIRTSRPSGVKTELAKIIEGWGDYFFYGFADPETDDLLSWFVGDLKVFRLWFNQYMARNQGRVPGDAKKNKDGSSGFLAFKVVDLPCEFVVGQGFSQ